MSLLRKRQRLVAMARAESAALATFEREAEAALSRIDADPTGYLEAYQAAIERVFVTIRDVVHRFPEYPENGVLLRLARFLGERSEHARA